MHGRVSKLEGQLADAGKTVEVARAEAAAAKGAERRAVQEAELLQEERRELEERLVAANADLEVRLLMLKMTSRPAVQDH